MNSGRIADVAEAIIDYRGRTPPKSPNGIKLLTAKVIKDGTIDESRLEYISQETYVWWMRRGFPQQRDILLTTEAPLGEVALLRSAEPIALAQRVILLRGDPAVIDQYYLFAALRSPLMQDRLRQRATGTTVLGIKQRELRQVEVPLPPLQTQRKIASILSAYDDLIENNNRRIKLLEEMAQRIYREWFVDYRYPGHENVPLVDSEFGSIPQGWTVAAFTDLADILSGGTPRTTAPEYWNGDIPFFTPRDAPDTLLATVTEKHITQRGLDRCNSQLYGPGTVFITARGTVGKVVMAGMPMAMNQSCYAVRGHEGVPQEFVLFVLLNQVDYLKTNTGGATFDTIIVDTFRRMRCLVPSRELIAAFAVMAAPLVRLIRQLQVATANLRATRDLILPRLIAGEVDVTDLDVAMAEDAA
jgi:type I restriction enzyme S subunit